MLHIVAAKAACFGEALRPEFKGYNQAVLDNARMLAATLAEAGIRLVAGGTDCGLMLVDLVNQGITGDIAAKALEHAGLAVNKNQIPFDERPPEAPSGLRLSSNAGTARGFGAEEFRAIGTWIAQIVKARPTRPSSARSTGRSRISAPASRSTRDQPGAPRLANPGAPTRASGCFTMRGQRPKTLRIVKLDWIRDTPGSFDSTDRWSRSYSPASATRIFSGNPNCRS